MGWLYSILLFAILILSSYTRELANNPNTDVDVESDSIASNMLIYANYARSYYITNPAATGTIADASLSLPSWYSKNSQISNVISGGYVFVYCTCTNMRDAVANQLYQSTDGSMFVGIKKSGAFVNPNSTTSISITPPATIPDNSVMYMVK